MDEQTSMFHPALDEVPFDLGEAHFEEDGADALDEGLQWCVRPRLGIAASRLTS